MSDYSLKIPSRLIKDTTLTPTQKMILSVFGNTQNLHLIDIAKRLGTKMSLIRGDIQSLVDQNRLFSYNGDKRPRYSTVKGFGFETNPVSETTKSFNFVKTQYNNNNNNNKNIDNFNERSELKLFSSPEDSALLAFKYWVDSGGINHREGSGVYIESIELLRALFDGNAFRHVPDSTIIKPLLNKTRKFDLEDWRTSIDNYVTSLTSPAHYPLNKQKALEFRKKLSCARYIYNKWSPEGSTRSKFLQYLELPKLVHSESSLYPKLTKSITLAFENENLRLKPSESQIIAVSNMYGKVIHDYEWKYPSTATAARVLMEFIQHKYNVRFSPNWMVSKWFKFDLENYLDRQGFISIER